MEISVQVEDLLVGLFRLISSLYIRPEPSILQYPLNKDEHSSKSHNSQTPEQRETSRTIYSLNPYEPRNNHATTANSCNILSRSWDTRSGTIYNFGGGDGGLFRCIICSLGRFGWLTWTGSWCSFSPLTLRWDRPTTKHRFVMLLTWDVWTFGQEIVWDWWILVFLTCFISLC